MRHISRLISIILLLWILLSPFIHYIYLGVFFSGLFIVWFWQYKSPTESLAGTARDLGRRIYSLIFLIPYFLYEALSSAVRISYYALQKEPNIDPRIIRVHTRLRTRSAIAIMANLITLTPGTLTIDFDEKNQYYLVHCIQAQAVEHDSASAIYKMEKHIRRIFEWST